MSDNCYFWSVLIDRMLEKDHEAQIITNMTLSSTFF